jgi:hypothetical protein
VRCIAAKRGFARVSPSDGDPVLVGASASILLFTRVASRSDTAVPALDVVSSPPRRVCRPSRRRARSHLIQELRSLLDGLERGENLAAGERLV